MSQEEIDECVECVMSELQESLVDAYATSERTGPEVVELVNKALEWTEEAWEEEGFTIEGLFRCVENAEAIIGDWGGPLSSALASIAKEL